MRLLKFQNKCHGLYRLYYNDLIQRQLTEGPHRRKKGNTDTQMNTNIILVTVIHVSTNGT